MEPKELIARRVAKELHSGDLVNLGIGVPTLVASFLPDDSGVILQSENGFVKMGPPPGEGDIDKDIINAGGGSVTLLPGGAYFDTAFSLSMIRGGKVDATVIGALEVDEQGNLANWIIPGKLMPGIGGAMDLTVGAKRVIIAMEHTSKNGEPKIRKKCTLPLTAAGEVNLIVTEKAVIEVTEKGLVLKEIAEGYTVSDIQSITEPNLIVDDHIEIMNDHLL